MEQNELLLKKLQSIPEYQEFQKERKIYALRAALFSIFLFCAVVSDIIRSVTHGISVRFDAMAMVIVLVCLVVSIGLVFISFAQKPVFVTNGVIKEVQRVAYRSYKANWYLVSDDTNQEYWGTSPLFLFHNGNENKSYAIGNRVLCFSMGGEKWIILE